MLYVPRAASANDTDLHWVLACFAKKSQPDFFFFFLVQTVLYRDY